MSHDARYAALVRSFHCFADAPVFAQDGQVDLVALDGYALAHDPTRDDGVACSAAFLLNLWTTRHPWKVGPFNLFHALHQWDRQHLAAFQAWAAAPWQP